MKAVRYSLIIVLTLSLAACGVRRDLKVPDAEKQQNEHAESAETSTPAQ